MKKGKRLLTFLIVTLTMLFAFTLNSFAQSNTFEVIMDGGTSGTTIGTVTLDANDVDYDGSTHLASVSNTLSNSYLINYEDIGTTPVYDSNSGHNRYPNPGKVAIGPTKYSYYDGQDWVEMTGEETEPVDAGEYLAEVTVYKYTEDVTYITDESSIHYHQYEHSYSRSELVSGEVVYTINPKTVTVSWSDTEKTYNGSDQFPTAKLSGVNSGDKVSVAIVDADGNPYAEKAHKDAKTYKDYAKLDGDDAGNYVLETDSWTNFTINPKAASVTWMESDGVKPFETEITYDGQNHLPKPVVEGAIAGEEISGVAANKSGTPYPADDKTHINHGNYTVYAKLTAGEGTKASNYTIPASSISYTINKRIVELEWFRPVYDNKTGDPIKSDGYIQYQKVKEGVTIGLVYNSREQEPVVKVTNVVEERADGKKDEVKAVVEVLKGKQAIEKGSYFAQATILYNGGSTNYTLGDAGNATREFEIIPRPVVLDWGYKETVDADPQYKENVHIDSDGYNYKTIYNGKLQEPVVEIINLPMTDVDNEEYDFNEVKKIELDEKTACDWPDSVAPTRVYTDAGIYKMHAGRMEDNKNYSYSILEQDNGDNATGSIGLSGTKADKYNADYTIEQLKAKLSWTPKPAEFKYYDGHEHHPECAIDNVQQNEKDVDDVYEFTYKIEKKIDGIYSDGVSIDAGEYRITVTEVDNKNYTLYKSDDPEEQVENISEDYIIWPRPVELKWDKKEFTYDANRKEVIATINNIQTPDEASGRTKDDVDVVYSDGVIDGKRYTHYEANAGSYTAMVPVLQGEQKDNYSLFAKPETKEEPYVKDYTHNWKINKKDLTVTVYDKIGYYGDDPATYKHGVKYTGLVNGDANKDNNNGVPGTYDANQFKPGEDKDIRNVVDGTLKYSWNYKMYGKPGKYSVSASGLTSANYNIKYVPGTLTIKDRYLTSELLSKAVAGNKKGTVSWTGLNGAAKYQIYLSLCNSNGKKYTPKYYKTVGANTRSYTIKKLKNKKLKKNTYYKYYIVALDKNGKRLAKTEIHHFCTNNVSGKFTNPKSIKASKAKVTVKKGKTAKVTATVTKVKSSKRLTDGGHTKKIRYRSGNTKVATVTQSGVIKGVGTGWCRVYVMAANGIWKTVEVTVN